jgi:uncharacterized coiled-coil protein SlyX
VAYTQSELTDIITRLETGVARQVRTIAFADRSETYASTQEMIDKIKYFRDLLMRLRAKRPKQFMVVAAKGF